MVINKFRGVTTGSLDEENKVVEVEIITVEHRVKKGRMRVTVPAGARSTEIECIAWKQWADPSCEAEVDDESTLRVWEEMESCNRTWRDTTDE